MEYVHSGKQSNVFMVKEKSSGTHVLAKLYTRSSDAENGEESVLSQLNHPGIPKWMDDIRMGDTVCTLREYIYGSPLNQLSFALDEPKIIDIGIQLTDILSYLHEQVPPVIHRDIKPQNIILSDDGEKVYLIDFGISRKQGGEGLRDTRLIGTEGFMPPEQYGFKQTDCRADIYSLGMLLCWLLTGETSRNALYRFENTGLVKILIKCTEFSPENRYTSADRLRRELIYM
jgi:serine/threonine protein kinase